MLELAHRIQVETPRFAVHLFVGASALFVAAMVQHNLTRAAKPPRALPSFTSMAADGKFEARSNGTLAFDVGRGLNLIPQPPSTFSFAADLGGRDFPVQVVRIAAARPIADAPVAATTPRAKATPTPPRMPAGMPLTTASLTTASLTLAPLPPQRMFEPKPAEPDTLTDFTDRILAMIEDRVRPGKPSPRQPAVPARLTLEGSSTALRPPRPIPGPIALADRERRRDGGFRLNLDVVSPRALVDSGIATLREVGTTSDRLIGRLLN